MKKEIYELIKENERLIYKIASKYSKYYNIEDLYQVGALGIIKAYKNYKNDKNTKFSTYAYSYILGEIIEYIKNDRTMKIGVDYLKIYKSYQKAYEFLFSKFERTPSIEEISLFLELDSNYLNEIIVSCEFVLSLDNELLSYDTTYMEFAFVDEREKVDNQLLIQEELEKLLPEERELIEYRYFKDYTQAETAFEMGITQVKVSRKEKDIIHKLRKEIAA